MRSASLTFMAVGSIRVSYLRRLAFTIIAALVGFSLGCGGTANPLGRQAVSGAVTLDGAPVSNGTIRFEPFDAKGKVTASGAIITAGRYSLRQNDGLPPGKYSVTISSHGDTSKPLPTDPNEAMNAAAKEEIPTELIPARYNAATELVIEITKDGKGPVDFKLVSEKK